MSTSISLLPSERIDDLLTNGLRIIQSEEVFSFSLDAVLLARFCRIPPNGKIVDLCSGNGVIPLLLSTRTKSEIYAVEIQKRLADMATRSVKMNQLDHQIRIICKDLRNLNGSLGKGQFNLVTVNPPYLPVPAGEQNSNPFYAAARHEIYCTLEDVIQTASELLRSKGKFVMVHRVHRLVDICVQMRMHRIEPKRIRMIHSRVGEEAVMVLVEGMKDGKAEVRMLPPLIVYNERNEYTEELHEVFYGKRDSI